jgi:hypothetical protein
MSTPPQPLTPATHMPMISPDGQIGDVPVEQADAAAKAGFKHAVDMISPDGKHGTIPLENAEAAQKAGFRLKGPTIQPPKDQGPIVSGGEGGMGSPLTGSDTPKEARSQYETGSAINVAGALGGEALGAVGAGARALTAPSQVVKTVGTGISDMAGRELMRDVLTEGPSIAQKTMQTLQKAKPYLDGLEKLGVPAAGIGYLIKTLHDLTHGGSK